ncbi:MAB_1171c family putative transporter [Streptomyces aureocirculatus]|uniref:MAB_1171c family putative transporter n=1 Tax=Streptomyces aureocirculatus TaxID=67275 RepID=UPI0004C7F1C2|nr:MAB_1171c family putative transporter [Streptomyces aureocirculatus]
MGHALLTGADLVAAVIALALATGKAIAARRDPSLALKLTASALFHVSALLFLATPAVYRAVDTSCGAPHLSALLIQCLWLLCVGHAQLLSVLWQPGHRAPGVLRGTVLRWAPLYAGTVLTMAALYVLADVRGAARPLLFATDHVRDPLVVAFHLVFFAALGAVAVSTLLRCRALLALRDPVLPSDLRRSVREFALAIGLDLAHVACALTAMIGAAGGRGVDGVAEGAWLITAGSGFVAHYSLVRISLAARRRELRDHRVLRPLWQTVVRASSQLVLAPGLLWGGWDTRIALSRRLVEIRDGARSLSPWMVGGPALAVARLARRGHAGCDLVAAQAAATLLHAADARARGLPPAAPHERLTALPGEDVPAAAEREHLVLVARHLDHPVVREALALVRAEGPPPLTVPSGARSPLLDRRVKERSELL